jgi:hypothetical protein
MRFCTCLPARWVRRFLLGSVLLLPFAPKGAGAQTASGGTGLTVISEPSGAVVTLRGPYVWVGQTPWHLDREVSGTYQVEARLPGYEPWRGEAVLGPGGLQNIRIVLSRRTPWKALGRSLLFPGWGQIYSGSKGKGICLASAWVLALGGGLWTEFTYQSRLDDFKDAQSTFEAQRQLGSSWNQAYQDVERASSRADRAYKRRQVVFGVAAGVYALSALDALFFPPGGRGM